MEHAAHEPEAAEQKEVVVPMSPAQVQERRKCMTKGRAIGCCSLVVYAFIAVKQLFPPAITDCSLLTVSSCGSCPTIVPQMHLCPLPYNSTTYQFSDPRYEQMIQQVCPGSKVSIGLDPSCKISSIGQCVSFSDALQVLEDCAQEPSHRHKGKHGLKEKID